MKFRYVILAAVPVLLCASILSVPLSRRAFRTSENKHIVMIVDAGHGGEDGGAVSADGWKESEVNLAVSLRLDTTAIGIAMRRVKHPVSSSISVKRRQSWRTELISAAANT